MWCLLVFLFLMWRRKKFKHNGDVFLWGVMLYTFERAFVENLRQDSLWLVKDVIRVSQLISVVLFVAVLAFLIIRYLKEKKNGVVYCPVVDNGPYFSPDALRAHKRKGDKRIKPEKAAEEGSEAEGKAEAGAEDADESPDGAQPEASEVADEAETAAEEKEKEE
ncbi:Prolipoprotein diacylglyceryl transferase [bioreactor metagenome]|uniref:Prolipoprotein diacylglyceryl transferase n=1 Tax=bioreactor metagenome TaxID=1076179 RepID=A0A645J4T8_9ZZZZ